jgi:hypothetical protein
VAPERMITGLLSGQSAADRLYKPASPSNMKQFLVLWYMPGGTHTPSPLGAPAEGTAHGFACPSLRSISPFSSLPPSSPPVSPFFPHALAEGRCFAAGALYGHLVTYLWD